MEKETTERRNTRPTRQTELGTEVQCATGDRMLVDVFHIDGTPDQMYMTAAERDSYQRTGVLP